MQIEMVWAHNKVNRTCKDDPTGHCTRREEVKTDRKRHGKLIYQNGPDYGWMRPIERLMTEKNGEKGLPDHP